MLFHNHDQTPALTLLFEGAPLKTLEWIRAKGVQFINYGREIKRSLFSQEILPDPVRGPAVVQANLIEGLIRLGYEARIFGGPFNITPSSQVGVLSGALDALPWAIQAKERGWVEKLVAGPNLVIIPDWHDFILCHPLIDRVIVPSKYIADIYVDRAPELKNKVSVWPVGVDSGHWRPDFGSKTIDFLVFEKFQDPANKQLLSYVQNYLVSKNYSIKTINYGSFTQHQYLEYLQRSRGMIYLTELESQGISLFEAWSTNVPTLIWDREQWIFQGLSYLGSSSPYMSESCGIKFNNMDMFATRLDEFMAQIETFEPRKYIIEKFSLEKTAKAYIDIFHQ